MKKLLLIPGLLLMMSLTTLAQDTPKVELFGGYSHLRTDGEGGPSTNVNGWHGSIAGNFNKYLGIAAEFSGHYGRQNVSPFNLGVPITIGTNLPALPNTVRLDYKAHTVLAGPRLSLRNSSRITPFAHVLAGGVRADATGTFQNQRISVNDTAFGLAVGGGLDVKITDGVALRLVQADYLLTRFGDTTQNNARISVGLVFRFGSK